ncbi:MAG: nucleotidyltransferase domain-containing protein [Methanothrix sp.]|uniref:DNA polymerase beta superfamily protein n=1 Tax=Methanothrix sp. TaxID=90426 RepID=UPI003BB63BB8
MIEQIDFENLPISELEAAKMVKCKGMKILYISCVGSHMWGMESKESDIDLVMIYIVPTKRILRGEKFPATIRQEMAARGGEIYDTLGWEIGHLIDLLIKGNVNAIWYATSPLVIMPSALQEELSAIVQANLCRESYHSIKGMAESQINSETGQLKLSGIGLVKRPGKGYRTALRTINFGIKLLREARISYEPVMHDPALEELKEGMNQLDEAYGQSMLPDLPDEDQFRDFLLRQRLKEMDEDAGKD